jgi:hypothetical protein
MAFLDIFAASELDEPDKDESDDLPLHVRQCSRRYKALDRKLTLLTRLVAFGFLVQYAANSPAVTKAVVGFFTP